MTWRMAGALALCSLFSQVIAHSQATSTTKRQRITVAAARKIALEHEAGIVKSGEREIEKGKLIYSFDIQMPNGTHEVNVDAYSGQVLEKRPRKGSTDRVLPNRGTTQGRLCT